MPRHASTLLAALCTGLPGHHSPGRRSPKTLVLCPHRPNREYSLTVFGTNCAPLVHAVNMSGYLPRVEDMHNSKTGGRREGRAITLLPTINKSSFLAFPFSLVTVPKLHLRGDPRSCTPLHRFWSSTQLESALLLVEGLCIPAGEVLCIQAG